MLPSTPYKPVVHDKYNLKLRYDYKSIKNIKQPPTRSYDKKIGKEELNLN